MLQAFTSEPNTRIKNTVQQMFKIVAAWSLSPILGGLWNYVTGRGGAIMARMDSSHPEAVSRHPKAQK